MLTIASMCSSAAAQQASKQVGEIGRNAAGCMMRQVAS